MIIVWRFPELRDFGRSGEVIQPVELSSLLKEVRPDSHRQVHQRPGFSAAFLEFRDWCLRGLGFKVSGVPLAALLASNLEA